MPLSTMTVPSHIPVQQLETPSHCLFRLAPQCLLVNCFCTCVEFLGAAGNGMCSTLQCFGLISCDWFTSAFSVHAVGMPLSISLCAHFLILLCWVSVRFGYGGTKCVVLFPTFWLTPFKYFQYDRQLWFCLLNPSTTHPQ